MKRRILDTDFFERDAQVVARELLGKFLVRKYRDKEEAHMIVEVEAYDGPHDLASHASKGRTKRTEVMFGEAGRWYVYLCYGMHWMLNIVTGPKDHPAAVLIRGVTGVSGPGRVTRALHIARAQNAQQAARSTRLWIEDRGTVVSDDAIKTTPRIGVAYAKEWAEKPLRFVYTA